MHGESSHEGDSHGHRHEGPLRAVHEQEVYHANDLKPSELSRFIYPDSKHHANPLAWHNMLSSPKNLVCQSKYPL